MSGSRDSIVDNLGKVTSYKFAKLGGFEGTEEEYGEYLANLPSYATRAEAGAAAAEEAQTSVEGSVAAVISAKDLAQAAATSAGASATSATASAATATSAMEDAVDAKEAAETAAETAIQTVSDVSEELQDIRVKADGTTAASAGDAVRDQVDDLNSDLGNLILIQDTEPTGDARAANKVWIKKTASRVQVPDWDDFTELKKDLANNIREIFGVTNKSDIDGEITFLLAYGYWAIESDVLKWKPANNKLYLSSVNPIKVDAGDVIHIKSGLNTRFFAIYSADGSTWSSLVNTTNKDKEITTDGYVLVSVRNEPSSTAWTDADIETFFANRISIVKKEYTNRAISRIDNIDGLTGLLANESGVVQIYVTASETTLEGSVYSGIEIPAVTGETIRIKAALSVAHPEYYGSIQLSVRERYNNGTVKEKNYSDLTNIIDYIVTNAHTTSIIFVFTLNKASASSVTTGYYENIKYSLAAIKKQESIDSVLTESGDIWEV